MNSINAYIKLICIISIVAGVVITLVPKGRMKSSFISLCSIILLSSMVLPFRGTDTKIFENPEVTAEKNSDAIIERTQQMEKELFETAVEDAVETNLRNSGIIADVTVEGELSEDEVSIETVTVYGDFDSETAEYIIGLLADDFGKEKVILKEAIND